MSDFEKAMTFVMKNEGGDKEDGGFVNHPNDRGGPTKYGISLKFWHDLDKKITASDIYNLTYEKACELYKKYFYSKYKCDKITDDSIAIYFFDCCVQHGGFRAVKFLQKALNYDIKTKLEVDGKIGEKTLEAVNDTYLKDKHGKGFLLNAMKSERANFMRNIVKNDETQRVNLKSWLARAERG